MDSNSSQSYHFSSSARASFQELINTYNSETTPPTVKTQSLEKINGIVQKVLKEVPLSDEPYAAQEMKDMLKQLKVRSEDQNLWSTIVGEINKAFPTEIRAPEMFFQVPTELYLKIMQNVKDVELLGTYVSPEQRFELALRLGEEVNRLDLTNFKSLDNEKLQLLQKACPNLRSLNLSGIPLEKLDLSILQSFSKLEKLNVWNTQIKTLDMLPKSLKELNVSDCKSLPAEAFQKLNESFPQLEKLSVAATHIATLDGLPKSLKALSLSDCIDLPAEEFQKLGSLVDLEELLAINTKIETLDTLLKSLKKLNLRDCEHLTAEGIQVLPSFDKLQEITLSRRFGNEEVVTTLRDRGTKVSLVFDED